MKNQLRGCDYRLSVILVHHHLSAIVTEDIRELLSTLLEICQHSYANANKRTPRFILHLHNLTFKHPFLCTKLFTNTTKISKQKMHGIYFNSLSVHLPQISRIVAPITMHSEEEERLFNTELQILQETISLYGFKQSTISKKKRGVQQLTN